MDRTVSRLTVYFDGTFWVGVFERIEDELLSVCKVTFGAEPKDTDVLDFILTRSGELKYSAPEQSVERQKADSPKRRMREARRQVESSGIGTKSQMALQNQREQMKIERKHISSEQRREEAQRRFEQKQAQKKEKKRGH